MSDRAMTPKDVAERMGVNVKRVYSWIDSGELEAVNVTHSPTAKRRDFRIEPEALEAFKNARRVNAPSSATSASQQHRNRSVARPRKFYVKR